MVSENRSLRRVYGPKREEVVGGWRRMHNEEVHNLDASSNIIWMIESRRITGWGTWRMEEIKKCI
jgi:hypothetical protein